MYEYTRKQLYDLVWASPMTSVAKTVGISDVALAKNCKKVGIPIPPRGYWAKHQAGKHVVQFELPQRGFGKSDTVRFGDRHGYWHSPDDLDTELPAPPSFPETAQEVIAKAQAAVVRVTFSKTLADPHQLIEKVLKEDAHRREQKLVERYYWKEPIFETPEARRKLKILNSVFCAMSRVGEKPYLRSAEPINVGVMVGDTSINFTIEAINPKRQTKSNDKPSREKVKLELKIELHSDMPEFQSTWQDGEDVTLENQVKQIAAGLLMAGEFKYRAQAFHSYNWLVERKAEHEEEKRKERVRLERERLERQLQLERKKQRRLHTDVLGWRKAEEIRAFVSAVNARCELNANQDSVEKLSKWSAWALAEADRMDPMKRTSDELVDYLWENLDNNA